MMQRTSTVTLPRRRAADLQAPGSRNTAARFVHPRFQRLPPPVIVIGMHRSGTSLIAGILGALGVYVGPELYGRQGALLAEASQASRVSGYAEAGSFFRLNELLLRTAGSDWSRVEPFLQRRDEAGWSRWAAAGLGWSTHRSLLTEYLAPLPQSYEGAWGWKDPRNSLTLPLWLRLFPEARIIDVRRSQEAVVDSLHRRALAWSDSGSQPEAGRLSARSVARKAGLLPPLPSDPCLDRNYCRRLCRIYVDECRRHAEGANPYLSVWYEDVLADPAAAVRTLAEFAGVSYDADALNGAVDLVRPRAR
jgi:hypothetical protein